MNKFYDAFRPFLGVLCFLLGVLVSFTPLPFGSLIMLTGIIMTSPEVKLFRSLLKWIEEKDPTEKQWAGRVINSLQVRLIPVPVKSENKSHI